MNIEKINSTVGVVEIHEDGELNIKIFELKAQRGW